MPKYSRDFSTSQQRCRFKNDGSVTEQPSYYYPGYMHPRSATTTRKQLADKENTEIYVTNDNPAVASVTTYKPLPIASRPSILKHDEVKPRIATCMFVCGGNVADVGFVPCGHRLVCSKCCGLVKPRRCAVCYTLIQGAKDLVGKDIELGARMLNFDENVESAKKKVVEAIRKEVAAKHDPEIIKLREKLEELEMRVMCQICMENRNQTVFQCGHKACAKCSSDLSNCHMCRRKIVNRIRIYQ